LIIASDIDIPTSFSGHTPDWWISVKPGNPTDDDKAASGN
jgi:hypothetical protein